MSNVPKPENTSSPDTAMIRSSDDWLLSPAPTAIARMCDRCAFTAFAFGTAASFARLLSHCSWTWVGLSGTVGLVVGLTHAVPDDVGRVAVGDEHGQVRLLRARARQEVAAHPQAVLPVGGPVRPVAVGDVGPEEVRPRRVGHGRVGVARRAAQREVRDRRELRHRDPRPGVVERRRERVERPPDGAGVVPHRPRLVEDHVDVEAARGDEIGVADRNRPLGRHSRRATRREGQDDQRDRDQARFTPVSIVPFG